MPSDRPKDPDVVSRSFVLSPAALEEVRQFVRQHLKPAPEDRPGPGDIASAAALTATEEGNLPVHLTMRLFSDHVEVTLGTAPVAGLGFREWLAEALRREGLSQEAAARRLGVSLKTVNRWIRGHSEPRMRELRRVQEVFGQPPLA
jgi:DNA-binding XRE family transcriptional regulator